MLLLLLLVASLATATPYVNLPPSYTAMKGDILVLFDLEGVMRQSFQINAVIHLEYLPGDSILLRPQHLTQDAISLASLPVPLGLTRGGVVFPCGTILRAGPHRAILTVDGRTEAISPILQVSWPPVSIRVPEALETYATDVDVVVSFTTNLCTPMMGQTSGNVAKLQELPELFETYLELVECSKSKDSRESCQMPTNRLDRRVWQTVDVRHFFYSKSSFTIRLNCSVWGQEGTFRVFLTTNLTHAAVIERSGPIRVSNNREYHLDSYFSTILPCHEGDIKPLTVKRPQCSNPSDKVRAYGQGQKVVGGNVLPGEWHYLGEVRLNQEDDNIAIFPCKFFHNAKDLVKYCFHYVSRSIIGTTNTTTTFCMPANTKDVQLAPAVWGPWSKWSFCSVSCGNDGTKFRHRICKQPENAAKRTVCQGKPVEYKICQGPPCKSANNNVYKSDQALATLGWKPLSTVTSPCACGCIYIVGQNRDIVITSGPDCPSLPITWKVKAGINHQVQIQLQTVEFSCANSLLNIRTNDGGERSLDELAYQTDMDVWPNKDNFNVTGKQVTLQFHAPRRSCRINLGVVSQSTADSTSTKTRSGEEEDGIFWTTLTRLCQNYPLVIIVFLAVLIVTILSAFCIMCQFEYRRKKYVAWKSQPSSGYSTPTPNMGDYVAIGDIETAHSSVEDLVVMTKRRIIKARLKRAAKILKKHVKKRHRKAKPTTSLPTSPFLTRRSSTETSLIKPQPLITAGQVKRALKAKSFRYRQGHFRPLNVPHAPVASPSKASYKRHSRSLSDILSILATGKTVHFELLKQQPATNVTKAIVCSTKGSNSSLATLKPTTQDLPGGGRCSSAAVATTSLSEFSVHSGMSGDQELEFDLYDCDLNNVSALPGSMFAPAMYYDLTPTADDELELTELFPSVVVERRDNKNNRNMVDSLTSDLAASVTSGDLTIREPYSGLDSSCYHSNEDDEDEDNLDNYHETDTLLQHKSTILNLTHIDDITFADEDAFNI